MNRMELLQQLLDRLELTDAERVELCAAVLNRRSVPPAQSRAPRPVERRQGARSATTVEYPAQFEADDLVKSGMFRTRAAVDWNVRRDIKAGILERVGRGVYRRIDRVVAPDGSRIGAEDSTPPI